MMYLIWSNEHMAWWTSAKWEYTYNISEAGLYTWAEARDICKEANIAVNWQKKGIPNEIPVPLKFVSDTLNTNVLEDSHGT